MQQPFWEASYAQDDVSTFAKGPTGDVFGFFDAMDSSFTVLDAGCGEGRNAIYMAEKGHRVDAFDLSENGIAKAKRIAARQGVLVNFFVRDLAAWRFDKSYQVILSHGVLHLPERPVRNRFIQNAQQATSSGGYHLIGVFTNRRPATPDNAPFTKSLFEVGELPALYAGWVILQHREYVFRDTHPGGVHHEHACEGIIAQKP